MRGFRFPGQEEALVEEMRRRQRRTTRRAALLAVLAGTGGLALGYGVHRWLQGDRPTDAQRAWARELAIGPRADLLAHHLAFCTVAERMRPDERIWIGIERLAHAVADERARPREAAAIARRVLLVFEAWRPPEHLEGLRSRLRAVAEGR